MMAVFVLRNPAKTDVRKSIVEAIAHDDERVGYLLEPEDLGQQAQSVLVYAEVIQPEAPQLAHLTAVAAGEQSFEAERGCALADQAAEPVLGVRAPVGDERESQRAAGGGRRRQQRPVCAGEKGLRGSVDEVRIGQRRMTVNAGGDVPFTLVVRTPDRIAARVKRAAPGRIFHPNVVEAFRPALETDANDGLSRVE
jgi:hypothetical protein